MSAEILVKFENVGIQFGSLVVHRNISFEIFAGENVTILGPSGVGKTLILKLIMGLLKPSKGKIMLFGRDISSLSTEQLREMRKDIGMLFQSSALFDSLSVFENVAYSLREAGDLSETEIETVVADKLSLVGLPGINDKLPSELSGGQRKRVGLARALASSPKIMLFDEPTTGLDPTTIKLIDRLIIELRDNHKITCISVTHDIESAKRISDRWMLINAGEIAAVGGVADLVAINREVQDFIYGNWSNELHCI